MSKPLYAKQIILASDLTKIAEFLESKGFSQEDIQNALDSKLDDLTDLLHELGN